MTAPPRAFSASQYQADTLCPAFNDSTCLPQIPATSFFSAFFMPDAPKKFTYYAQNLHFNAKPTTGIVAFRSHLHKISTDKLSTVLALPLFFSFGKTLANPAFLCYDT